MEDSFLDMETERANFERQFTERDITNPRVLMTMMKVPRAKFVPTHLRNTAYGDFPLPIGHGQTISQPYIVAFMTQALDPGPKDRVLEIGTGCGYQTAVLAELSHEVFSIECIEDLALSSQKRLKNLHYDNVYIHIGNGYFGWEEKAPFDCIIVTAAAPEIPPPLLNQLATGGRMIIPVGPEFHQELKIITKDRKGNLSQKSSHGVRFVPFISGIHWKKE